MLCCYLTARTSFSQYAAVIGSTWRLKKSVFSHSINCIKKIGSTNTSRSRVKYIYINARPTGVILLHASYTVCEQPQFFWIENPCSISNFWILYTVHTMRLKEKNDLFRDENHAQVSPCPVQPPRRRPQRDQVIRFTTFSVSDVTARVVLEHAYRSAKARPCTWTKTAVYAERRYDKMYAIIINTPRAWRTVGNTQCNTRYIYVSMVRFPYAIIDFWRGGPTARGGYGCCTAYGLRYYTRTFTFTSAGTAI